MQCLLQGLPHAVKLPQNRCDEIIGDHPPDFILRGHVVFLHFVGLLQQPLLYLDEIPVVPMKQGDLAFRVLNFADYTHADKVVNLPDNRQTIVAGGGRVNQALLFGGILTNVSGGEGAAG